MTALPIELAVWSGLPNIRQRGTHEWSASCPNCGEFGHVATGSADVPDRFRMWSKPAPRGWCRQCGFFAFADQDHVQQLEPVEILRIEEHRKKQEEAELRRRQAKIEELQRQAYWQGYHDAMQEEHRKLWEDEGITPDVQDWFCLGYTPEKPYYYDDKLYRSPALTIPFFEQRQVVNVQYRLMQPIDGAGKYRFTSELTPTLYKTESGKTFTGDTCLLVEGAKKAIVLYTWLGHKYDHVVGSPSKYLSDWMYTELDKFETVFLLLDPDSFTDNKEESKTTVMRTARKLGDKARIVRLPVKPDDYLIKHHQSHKTLHRIIQQGRRLDVH